MLRTSAVCILPGWERQLGPAGARFGLIWTVETRATWHQAYLGPLENLRHTAIGPIPSHKALRKQKAAPQNPSSGVWGRFRTLYIRFACSTPNWAEVIKALCYVVVVFVHIFKDHSRWLPTPRPFHIIILIQSTRFKVSFNKIISSSQGVGTRCNRRRHLT